MDNQQLDKILSKFDQVIELLKVANKPVSKMRHILDLVAIAATIAGFVAVLDVIKNWMGAKNDYAIISWNFFNSNWYHTSLCFT